ncbi:MAG: hypothetical protein V3W06_09180 [Acidimicrobiia bacterium]
MTLGIPTIHVDEGAPVSMRSRWTKQDGVTYVQADITSITQNTYSVNSATPYTVTNTTALTVATVITDALVTTADWKKDGTGYNFDVVVAASLFPDGGGHYRVEFVIDGVADADDRIYKIEVLVGDSYS